MVIPLNIPQAHTLTGRCVVNYTLRRDTHTVDVYRTIQHMHKRVLYTELCSRHTDNTHTHTHRTHTPLH
jgi:hypothetical protein